MYANELDTPAPLSERPLQWREAAKPEPADGQILIEVAGCGVCRSNLHMIEGEWVNAGVPAISPIIPSHEVTGHVAELGAGVTDFAIGDPVGVQPLWWTCEECEYCTSGREHLYHQRKITGEHVDGGYAEYMISYAAHTYHVPEGLDLVEAAPLFCPGITAIKPSLLGNRGQMRTVLQLAAEGKVRTVVDRFPMEKATDVLELLAAGTLRSRAVLDNARG
jgi:propanol-preferring alcohol dehydrogenase